MLNILYSAAQAGAGSAPPDGILGFLTGNGSMIIVVVALVGVYFLMSIPQKNKEKKAQEKRNNIDIGDEITTIGGVIGRVVSLKEDSIVLETAGDRTRMRFKRWAIQDVNKLELETPGDSVSSKQGK